MLLKRRLTNIGNYALATKIFDKTWIVDAMHRWEFDTSLFGKIIWIIN